MNKFCLLFFLIIGIFFLPHVTDAAFYENDSNFVLLEKLFFKKQKYLVFLIFFFTIYIFF